MTFKATKRFFFLECITINSLFFSVPYHLSNGMCRCCCCCLIQTLCVICAYTREESLARCFGGRKEENKSSRGEVKCGEKTHSSQQPLVELLFSASAVSMPNEYCWRYLKNAQFPRVTIKRNKCVRMKKKHVASSMVDERAKRRLKVWHERERWRAGDC
jgi:hypothetical protein